jgi:hypothetical protein
VISSLLRTPLDSPLAFPVAGGLGAVVGGSIGLVFQGIANLPVDMLVGGLMGVGWCGVQRGVEATTTRIHHFRAIADYPAVKAILRKAGTDENDLAALHLLTAKLEETFGTMIANFKDFCDLRGQTASPLVADLIRHFYLTHCADRGVVVLSKRGRQDCYLVATHSRNQGRISEALNASPDSVSTVLRQMRCPFFRIDLVNETLANAQSFTTEERNGEWTVSAVNHRAGETLETVQPSSLVETVRRRCTRRAGPEEVRSAADDVRKVTTDKPAEVKRGTALCATIRGLPEDSRTLCELRRIEQDLAAYRSCGHYVTYQGRGYLSIDIHLDGRRSPGRNAWRLLYFRTTRGYMLHDIVDYHPPRS